MSTLLHQQQPPRPYWLAETQEHERLLLQQALAGEISQNDVLLYLQPRLERMATRVYNRLSQSMRRGNVIERGDLVNSANVAILTRYQAALEKESPFGYLFQVARIQMIHFVNGRTGNLVNTRNSRPITVLSLDIPTEDGQTLADELVCESSSPGNGERPSFARLLCAVESLPERERTVVQYHHGFGQAPQSLNQISKLFSASPRTGIARRYYQQALQMLRQTLSLSPEFHNEDFSPSHSGGTR